MKTIRKIINTDFKTIDEDQPISKAISRLKNTDGIIIVSQGKYEGVLQKRDISRAKISVETKAKTFIKHVAKVSVDETLEATAGLMLESDSYLLPVFDNETLIGEIRAIDLLKQAVRDDFGKESVDNFISKPVLTIHPSDPVSKAMELFNQEDISRLPVVKNNSIKGILILDDIITKFIHPEHRQGGSGQYADLSKYGAYMADKSDYLDIPVEGIMNTRINMTGGDETIESIVMLMEKQNNNSVLITHNNHIQGIVTKRDLLEPLAVFTVLDPMVVQFSGKLDRITDFEKPRARDVIHTNFEKYMDYLDNAHIYVRLKRHDEQRRGKHLIYCKMRLSSPRGMFIASAEGWGYLDAINIASEAIDKQIRRDKT